MSNKYGEASKAHFTAMKLEAEAVLDTYFTNSVGVGEHSDILVEVNKWVDKLATAEDALVVLGRFKRQQNGKATADPENKSRLGHSV